MKRTQTHISKSSGGRLYVLRRCRYESDRTLEIPMVKTKMKTLVSLILAVALPACATVGSLEPGTGKGSTFEVDGHSYDEVWASAIAAATSGLTLVESDKSSGIIKAEARAGIATWGEVVGIFIDPASEDASISGWTVEVVSLKRSRLQITGQNWETTIIEGMKAHLAAGGA